MKEAIESLIHDKQSPWYDCHHSLDVWHSLILPLQKMNTGAATAKGKEFLMEIQNWMMSFYLYVETTEELDISLNNLMLFTGSQNVAKELGNVLTQQITDFIQTSWDPNRHKFAKCYRMDKLHFGLISSNPAEHTNKFVKTYKMATAPNVKLKNATEVIFTQD